MESIINIKKRRRSKLKFSLSHRLQELKEIFIANGGEFKECKIGDFFLVEANPQLNKDSFVFNNTNKYPYFTRTMNNNGILGYVDYLDEEHKIKGNSIAVGMLGMRFFYMEKDFYAGQFTKTIFPKFSGLNEKNVLYFISWFNKSSSKFTSKLVRDFESLFLNSKMELPFYLGELSLDFMEKYIRELEVERIRELEAERIREFEAYLEASGLNDTILSEEENAAINKITNGLIKYKEFKIGGEKGLFSSQTGNFDIQKIHINDKGNFVVSSGEQNNGIIGKTDVDAKIIKENTITVDMFGNVFFRDYKYKMVTHARVFSLEYNNGEISREVGMYFVVLMKYFKKKFSYSDMASYEKIKNIEILLPITPNGNIDFDFMEKYIRAIEKKAIKGVVDWKDKVIAKTKEVVAFSDKDNRCIGL